MPDGFVDGKNMILIKPSDVEEIVKSVEKLIKNKKFTIMF